MKELMNCLAAIGFVLVGSQVPALAVWYEQAALTASDAAGGDGFARSVVTSGNYAIVGAQAIADLAVFGLLFHPGVGLVHGMLLGIIPCIPGAMRNRLGLGIGGFASCAVAGAISGGLLLGVPVCGVFVWLIMKNAKA